MNKFLVILTTLFCFSSGFAHAELLTTKEFKARAKIIKKFDAQYTKLVHGLKKILKKYDDAELEAIFKDRKIFVGNIVEMTDVQALTSRGALEEVMTEQYRMKLIGELADQIEKAGSAENFKKSLHHKQTINWCMTGKIAAEIAFAPIVIGGLVGLGLITHGIAPLAGIALVSGLAGESVYGLPLIRKDCKFVKKSYFN